MKAANDPEAIRVEQVRSLFKAWVVRQPKKQPGWVASTAILMKFQDWMLRHRPKLLPRGDPYQLLKSDLKGLIDDV